MAADLIRRSPLIRKTSKDFQGRYYSKQHISDFASLLRLCAYRNCKLKFGASFVSYCTVPLTGSYYSEELVVVVVAYCFAFINEQEI